jgi:hypothetical protein
MLLKTTRDKLAEMGKETRRQEAEKKLMEKKRVLNAVKERGAQTLIQELHKDIAELELAYIENENSLNMDYAYALGFRDVESRQFVTRTTNLTLR